MPDVVAEARQLKNKAIVARDLGDNGEALALLANAEALLRTELTSFQAHPSQPGLTDSPRETEVKKQLYHILGSIGGVHRREREFEKAEAAYEKGRAIEKEFKDSYNLVQGLVSRVLSRPSAVGDAALQEKLRESRAVIEGQNRTDDEYAIADLMTVSLLLGDQDWQSTVTTFASKAPPGSYARTVTCEVLDEITREANRDAQASVLALRLAEALRTLKTT